MLSKQCTGSAKEFNFIANLVLGASKTSMAGCLDRSKKALAERSQKRSELTLMLRTLGHYVEITSAGDESTLLSSGFDVASTTRNRTPQPLAQPYIVKI